MNLTNESFLTHNMSTRSSDSPWWLIPVFILFLPLILVLVVLSSLYALMLNMLVWLLWLSRGKDILLVYSESPHWEEFMEEEILPRIRHRAVVLNWSHRGQWLGRFQLAPMLFRRFGGDKNYNPIAIHFRFLRLQQVHRFREPILKWRKKNDRGDLDALLDGFFSNL